MSVDQITRTYKIGKQLPVQELQTALSDLEKTANENYVLVRGTDWMDAKEECWKLPKDEAHMKWVTARFSNATLFKYDKMTGKIVEYTP